jgi:PiT family inorganic phosphate transporter
MADTATPAFVASAAKAEAVFARQAAGAPVVTVAQARAQLGAALRTHKVAAPPVYAALGVVAADITRQVQQYHSVKLVPAAATPNMRNDMYLTGDTLRLLTKSPPASLDKGSVKALNDFKGKLQDGTRFIPTWVKIAVALALGLGTMVGWKRIVVTVGEKIGKTHLTYGQGAAAELVAFGTIYTLAGYGLPVSTTHILSSGVAGTMAANGSGLQWRTLLNIALAWITTLPAAIMLAGGLYWLLRTLFGG